MLRRLRPWQRRLLEVVLILAVALAVRGYMQRDLVSGPAPVLEGVLLDGRVVSLDALARRDGPVLVHFWATWCPICGLEHDSIQAISRDHPVVSVAMQSGDTAQVREFMHEEALDYPVLVDELGALAGRYGVRGVPTSLVVDREGRIRFTEVGYTTEWGLRARLWLAR